MSSMQIMELSKPTGRNLTPNTWFGNTRIVLQELWNRCSRRVSNYAAVRIGCAARSLRDGLRPAVCLIWLHRDHPRRIPRRDETVPTANGNCEFAVVASLPTPASSAKHPLNLHSSQVIAG